VKKKTPRYYIRRIQEYFFFRNKRLLFDLNLDSATAYSEDDYKKRDRAPYYEYAKCLEDVFPKFSEIMDIGCANSYLLEYFHNKDVKVAGIEGVDCAFKYMPACIKNDVMKASLSAPLTSNGRTYDIVNCTEIGEHIPYKYEEIFLENTVKFVRKFLILSWANTWEGWHGMDEQSHVNPRPKRYVIKKLKGFGLEYNGHLTNSFKSKLNNRNVFDYWIDRVMVFTKK